MKKINKKKYIEYIEIIEIYIKKRYKTKVCYDSSDKCYYLTNKNIIYINSYLNYEYRFYTLIHEIGHVMISYSKMYGENFPICCYQDSSRTKKARLDILREEIYAWDMGRMLIEQYFNIKLKYRFFNYMYSCLDSYVDFVINGKYLGR